MRACLSREPGCSSSDVKGNNMKMSQRTMILTLVLACLMAAAALAVPGDEKWATTWGLPGTDAQVYGTAEFQGDLIIVGAFTQVGDVSASGVARFDGTSWSAMGGGLVGTAYAVQVYNNELYVGGDFTLADGTPAGGLVKWSGSAWIPDVGGGTDATVEVMTVYAGSLIIAGDFYTVGGGVPVGGIAGWDGSSWNDLDGGTDPASVYGLAADATHLYATGYFETMGPEFVNNVARWDGTAWSALGAGLTDEFGDPFSAEGSDIHVWNGQVVVAGYFTQAGGQHLVNLAVWDAGSWGTLGGDPDFFLDGAATIAEYAGDLLVYNTFSQIWEWNGLYWDANITGGEFWTMGHYGSSLVLGGNFFSVNGVKAENLALYDSATASASALAPGNGINGSVDVVHNWNGQLVAGGGGQTVFGDIYGEMLALWDGTQWQSLGGGLQEVGLSYLQDLETYQGDLVVSGIFSTAGGLPISRIARWDGTAWSQVGDGADFGVGDMEVVNGVLYALVHQPTIGGVARLNDLTNVWEFIASPSPGTTFAGLGQFNGQLVVGGNFPDIEGVAAQSIAIWDGTGWAPLGAGIEGRAALMVEQGGILYVGGGFNTAGGISALDIAAWDGVSWSALGSGLNNQPYGLAAINGDIYVTGVMTTAGGLPASHVARWDGTAWQALGSGLNGNGRDIAVLNGQMFVGGDFSAAGGHFSAGIAAWSLGAASAVGTFNPNTLALAPGAPNPFTSGTTFFFELNEPGDVRVDIFDVRGYRVSRQALSGLEAGQHSFRWDGRDIRGRKAANGTYFVQVRAAGRQAMRRVTLVR